MPEHINTTTLIIGLAAWFCFRFVALMAFLLIMLKIQKFDFKWRPLIGAALLASALDMIPLVGHYIAVPVLYLCIWKIANCEIFPDAAFTVVLSYALMRCLTLVILAYAPMPALPHTASASYDFDDATNAPTVAVVQPANQAVDTAAAPAPPNNPDNKIVPGISLVGVSGVGNGAIVTIKYGQKDYSLSADEGISLSTDSGTVPVRLLGADEKEVALDVGGQTAEYPVK